MADHSSPEQSGQTGSLVESHSIDFIPEGERHGHVRSLSPMWFGANSTMTTLLAGSLAVSTGFSLVWAAVGLIVGVAVGSVFMALHSAQGPLLGLPQMIQSRAQFGFYGANVPLVVVILMYLGFFASGAVLAGEAIAALTHWPVTVGILVVAVASMILVLFGYRVIHYFYRFFTVFGLAVFALFTIALLTTPSQGDAVGPAPTFQMTPFLLTVALAAIYQLSYAPYTADYSRYLPSNTKLAPAFWYTYGGVSLSALWMMGLGLLLQQRYPELDVITQLQTVAQTWGRLFELAVLLVIAIGIVGINSLNIYGAFMATLTIVTCYVRHWRPTVALRFWFIIPLAGLGIYAAILQKDNFLDSYQDFLSFLLYFLVPWTAVNLADFYLVRHGSYTPESMFDPRGQYGRFSGPGLISYAVGCAIQVPFVNVPYYEGFIARALGGADISWIVGLLISGLCYVVLVRRRVDGAAPGSLTTGVAVPTGTSTDSATQ